MSESDLRHLVSLGYSQRWAARFAPFAGQGLLPGRVLRDDRGSSLVALELGVARARPSSALVKRAAGPLDLPAAGDWVVVRPQDGLDVLPIEAVLERDGAITRSRSGEPSDLQVLAANVDVVFVVHHLAGEPNLRRIERELALAWDSGAVPVLILTKADLAAAPERAAAQVTAIAPGVDVRLTSSVTGEGVVPLLDYADGHQTVALIGPSGSGKSTLINAMLGEDRQATQEVRVKDGRGRHTTVSRELVPLPNGGVLIDTPGLRSLGLTGSGEGLSPVFDDIERAAAGCRFRDCTHSHEPGCAVRAAVEAGVLPAERLASYHKLRREAQVAAMKTDVRLRQAETRKWKTIQKSFRDYGRDKG